MATLRLVAGDPCMHDPMLLHHLSHIHIPTLLIWDKSDRIITPTYGRACAAAFSDVWFEVIKYAGYLPQLEQPAATFAPVADFASAKAGSA